MPINKNKHLTNTILIFLLTFAFLFSPSKVNGETKNGFDITSAIIDKDKILKGGHPRELFRMIMTKRIKNLEVNNLKLVNE